MLLYLVTLMFWAGVLGLILFFVWLYRFPRQAFMQALMLDRRLSRFYTRTLEVAGHSMEYLDTGPDPAKATLVLLHGFGANKDHWVRVTRYLNKSHRVIAPDLPGFGNSSRLPEAHYGLAEQLERIGEFLDVLEIERCYLGGNSMGGYLAAAFAARYPDRVQGLWLLAPAGVGGAEESETGKLIAAGDNPLVVANSEQFERLVDLCFVKPPYVPPLFRPIFIEQAVADRPFNEKIFADIFADPEPLEPLVEGLEVPTLVVWGDHDRLLHPSGAEILGRLFRNARVVIMPDMGHIPMMERPADTAATWLAFRPAA